MDIGASYYKTLLSTNTDNAEIDNKPINDSISKEPAQEPLTENFTPTQEPTSALNEAKAANNAADFRKYQLLSQIGEKQPTTDSRNSKNTISNQTPNKADSLTTVGASKSADSKIGNANKEKEAVYVIIPKGKDKLSDYNILFATAQEIYKKEGINVSKAAIEELVGRNIVIELKDFKPNYLRGEKGKLVLDENKQPIKAYLVNVDPSFKQALLKFQPEAERITKAAIPAVHDLTDEQRFDLAVSKAVEKYGFISNEEALREIISPLNIGVLAVSRVVPGPTAIAGAALFTVNTAPEIYQLATDAKRLIYAPTKPSDLDLAADKLAKLYQIGVVTTGSELLNKGIGKAERFIDKANIPSIPSKFDSLLPPPSNLTPALATPGQTPFNWRMPIFEPTLRPAVPGSNLSRPNSFTPNSGFSGIRENISSNNFGGPLGRPLPFRSQGNNGENKPSEVKKEDVDNIKSLPEDNAGKANASIRDFDQTKANAYSSIDSAKQLLDKNPKLKTDFDYSIRQLQKKWEEASEAASDPELKDLALGDFMDVANDAKAIKLAIEEKLPKPTEPKAYITEERVAKDNETILADKEKFTKTNLQEQDRQVYKDEDGNYYYVDNLHKGEASEIEVFNTRGEHLGTLHTDGTRKGDAIPGRKINVK